MKKFKFRKKVITMRKGDNIVDVLKNAITVAEGKFSLIHIETDLIDKNIFKNLKEFKEKDIYGAEIEDYKIIIRDYGKWCCLYYFYNLYSKNVYTMLNNCFDYIDGFIDGIDIYIRKWESKIEIDEE